MNISIDRQFPISYISQHNLEKQVCKKLKKKKKIENHIFVDDENMPLVTHHDEECDGEHDSDYDDCKI